MNSRTPLALLLLTTLLVGCAVGPDYRRPPITSPAEIRGAAPDAASLADAAWWEILDDEVLKQLIREALENSYDVRLATWRLEEARAIAGIARSERYPAVQLSAGWARVEASEFLFPGSGTTGLYDVNLGLAWEIDLWGRVRRLNEAALAQYLATDEARRGVLLSLVAEVATQYFELRTLDLRLEIARRTEGAFRETHQLFRNRLDAGLASSLETSSAEATLAATSAVIPDLERRIAAQENALQLLIGRNPGEVPRGKELNDQLLPPEIPAGLPSSLLERRPDLRQAEQELVAANAEVGVAVANYFPRISLTGAFGGVAPEVSDLFGSGRAWSAGGGLLTPVFQGARLKREHEAAIARFEQAKVLYERSVTNAFGEVSSAIIAYQKLADVERERERSVAAHREAVRLANSRYRSGLSDYLEVLQAEQELFPAENFLAQTRFERLATLVELYRALGGGWKLADAQWSEVAARTGKGATP